MEDWEVERAVERGIRRANGENVDDDGCLPSGCGWFFGLLLAAFFAFLVIQSGAPWDW
ncbi:hypothetical protein [Streptomyces sp. NPDC127112]|uniref:hypothetical protein n=1 Tax=Streptomyces sp. NPDC127112 TaxID=3345364 RepID=UPI00363A1B07